MTGKRIGYRRVSTVDQSLDRQELPADIDPKDIFEEKLSGKSRERPALESMIRYVRQGDEVFIWSIDRLARNLRDLEEIVDEILAKGASIHFMSEGLDFRPGEENGFTRMHLQLLGIFAQFERSLSRQRQLEGIEKAKAKGVFEGKKPSIDRAAADVFFQQGHSIKSIAKLLGCNERTVYRLRDELGYKVETTKKITKDGEPVADNGEEAAS